jgi:hypothetical protein
VNVENLSPLNRDLLAEALPLGELTNELYRDGRRLDAGFSRERRCFALGERGWLAFIGWDGVPASRRECRSRWALAAEAVSALSAAA